MYFEVIFFFFLKKIVTITFIGIFMILSAFVLQSIGYGELSLSEGMTSLSNFQFEQVDSIHEDDFSITDSFTNIKVQSLKAEYAPSSVLRIEVFEGMTMEELTDKLNRSLGGILAGHGDVIAAHSLSLGIDPYVAAAIMIHETGNGTSRIANSCFNFGGQKGSGCGAYKKYNSVDEGLRGMIDNLNYNYYSRGLTTIDTIAPRYAESSDWPAKIHYYVNRLRAA